MSTDVSDSSMSDSSQSCHKPSKASEEELEVVTELLPSSPPYLYAGLGTQYYVTTAPRDIFGRAMPGTYFRAESAYFKREKDDSRDILTAFKYRRRFLDISNYEKRKKKFHVICTLKVVIRFCHTAINLAHTTKRMSRAVVSNACYSA